MKHIDHSEILSFERKYDVKFDNLQWMDIPYEDLHVTQNQWDTFNIEHVFDILQDFHPALLRASSVAYINGKYYLWEGQHSATAAYLKGIDKIHCGVYTCEDMSFKDIPSVEQFGQGQIADLIKMFMEETGATTIEDVILHINLPNIDVL